ncbi:MAG: hypothetical protein LBJ63_08365 [Prevotellaceae bacterium]|jgi:hypothetical protein|nr:hypothetical protein [Prevotellaceae bacterium]
MKEVCVILSALCFIRCSCGNKETEIIRLENVIEYYNDGKEKAVHFVIANPPDNRDSLLSLASEHFKAFAPNDTIEKYRYYNHLYFKETGFTPRDYKIEWKEYFNPDYIGEKDWTEYFSHDDIEDHYEDLLILITINPKYNSQRIIFYKKGNRDKEIEQKWKEEQE